MSDKSGLVLEELKAFRAETNERIEIILQQLFEVRNTQKEQGEILAKHEELLNQLVESQENQNDLLETLSVRSTKQDAEILRLKRNKNAI